MAEPGSEAERLEQVAAAEAENEVKEEAPPEYETPEVQASEGNTPYVGGVNG